MNDEIPVFRTDLLASFIARQVGGKKIIPVVYPTEPKFLIHIPKLDEEGVMIVANIVHRTRQLHFPNVKEADFQFKQNDSIFEIGRVEGSPQIVTTDGDGWVVVNASDKYDAIKWLAYLRDKVAANGGVVNRKIMEDFIVYVQGFKAKYKYDDKGNLVIDPDSVVPHQGSVLSFAFDLYTMQEKNRASRYESKAIMRSARDGKTGLYYKKMEPYHAIYIPGHFKVQYGGPEEKWMQTLEYHHGAMITLSPDGSIASVDPSNINSCYGFLGAGIDPKKVDAKTDRSKLCANIMADDAEEPDASIIPRFSLRDIATHGRDRLLETLGRRATSRDPAELQ